MLYQSKTSDLNVLELAQSFIHLDFGIIILVSSLIIKSLAGSYHIISLVLYFTSLFLSRLS